MRFKKVELHAFRAYENKENGTFDFTLPNDKIASFVSIYAPNGFGKTSFYDGVEWAVTKNISRLANYEQISKAERKVIEMEYGHREKQYVLKNKYSLDEIGYVNILTEEDKVFRNTTVKLEKSGSTDFRINDNDNNKYFKNVILSQDGIDNFLKADDDKERYAKFISHFGNKTLSNYYNNIEKLEKKNNLEEKEIKKKIDSITKDINQDIDDNIFESTNNKINEFNLKNPEKLDIIDDDFNEIKKGELETKLIQAKNNLNQMVENTENKLIPELPNWLKKSEKYFKDKITWKDLKNKLNDYTELIKINKGIKIIQGQIDISNKEKDKLQYLTKIYPQYESIKSEINKIDINIKELNVAKLKDEKDLDEIVVEYSKISIEINTKENEKKEIDELLINIPIIYENIEKLQKYISDMKIFRDSLIKNKHIKDAIKSNIFIDIRTDERYKLKIKNIEVLIKENILYEEKLTSLQHKKHEYQEYNRELKNLLSLGIQIIDKTQKNICPLCNTKQDNYDVLKNKVLNNPLLNTLEKELLEEEEKIHYSIKTNNKKIEENKNFITLELDKEDDAIKNKIDKLNYQIKSIYQNNIEVDENALLLSLLTQTENMNQNELVQIKTKKQSELQSILDKLIKNNNNFVEQKKKIEEKILLAKRTLEHYEQSLNKFQNKEEYLSIYNYINEFKSKPENILEQIKNDINNNTKLLNDNYIKLNNLMEKKLEIINQYSIENIDTLNDEVELIKDKIFKIYTENIFTFESFYEQFFKNMISSFDNVKRDIKSKEKEFDAQLLNNKRLVNLIEIIEKNTNNLLNFIQNKKMKKELEEYNVIHALKIKIKEQLSKEKKKLENKINKDVEEFFHEDLINKIYEKIDPHPEYKKVKFECHFENGIGKLNIFVDNNSETKYISPALYYSTAQLNVLSLSIFLAKALNVKDNNGENVDCIFIDDPIQSMDSINILSTIDLLRSLVVNHNKQIILSTHDENFHYLLQKKIPIEHFDSKFIELETFGKVKNI